MLEDGQTAADFVERRHRAIARLLGLPDGRDLAPERIDGCGRLFRRQVGPIAEGEHIGDPAMRLQQGATHDLGRMGREYELDAEGSHRFGERAGRAPRCTKAREQIGA